MSNVPAIRDGDLVEFELNGETLQGHAVWMSGRYRVMAVECELGVVVPDQRFPVLLLEAAADACEGHPDGGLVMGETFYCDGTCR